MDLEMQPQLATALCLAAEARLADAMAGLDDAAVRADSRLPGWTRGHVLTHLARNADAHARRIRGALDGQDVGKYPGGCAQRRAEIEQGASRPATEILADLQHSQESLAMLLRQADAAGWPNAGFLGGGQYGVGGCPAHRLREVEMHHVDLHIGYDPGDWPAEYVAWEMTYLLPSVEERKHDPTQRASTLAWLAGRGSAQTGWNLDPWG